MKFRCNTGSAKKYNPIACRMIPSEHCDSENKSYDFDKKTTNIV